MEILNLLILRWFWELGNIFFKDNLALIVIIKVENII